MKNLVMLFCVLFLSHQVVMGSETSDHRLLAKQVLAEYSYGLVEAVVDNFEPGKFVLSVVSVNLFSDGTLKVSKTDYRADNRWWATPDSEYKQAVVTYKKLSRKAFNLLKEDVIALSHAEVVENTQQIVCMMMPSFEQTHDHLFVVRDYDYETHFFSGEEQLVDGPHGCWNSDQIHLKNQWHEETAHSLKRSLKLLSL